MRLPPLLASLLVALACGTVQAEAPPRFPTQAVWHQDISNAATHADSATMISGLAGLGGFGYGRMQIDFSMHIVHAPANAPTRTIVGFPSNDEYYAPDCEPVGTPMPVPANAAIEGQTGLTCDNGNGDCHLLVVQGNTLYEAYTANASGATGLESMCLAVWKLDRVYQDSNRGEHCTSADAAGFPIAPLLFNADEVHAAMQVANGDLGHAIRFILPNPRMATNLVNGVKRKVYVRPASHAGGPSGPEATVPYGARLRLRSDFPVHLYPAGAQVVLRTMQRYGIVLADGGNIALTAESDRYTTRKWTEVGITARVFDQAVPGTPVRVQDFAVIDTGPRIVETYDCVRNAEPPPPPASTPPTGIASRLLPATGGVRQIQTTWQGGAAQVDVSRNGQFVRTMANGGSYVENYYGGARPGIRICNTGTTQCAWTVPTKPLPEPAVAPAKPAPVGKRLPGRVTPGAARNIGKAPSLD